jgi:hypothetical protein
MRLENPGPSSVYYLEIGYLPYPHDGRRRAILLGVWYDPGEAEAVSIQIDRLIAINSVQHTAELWEFMKPLLQRRMFGFSNTRFLRDDEDPMETEFLYTLEDIYDLIGGRNITYNVYEMKIQSPNW